MNSQALVKREEQSSRLAQVPAAGLFARIVRADSDSAFSLVAAEAQMDYRRF